LARLLLIVPEGAILYFEGCGIPAHVKRFLESRALPGKRKLPGGTWLPTPNTFHLVISDRNLADLGAVLGLPETDGVPTHIHVYHGNSMILQWYDTSAKDPIHICSSIEEEKMRAFCDAVGCSYRRVGQKDG
jgi:hypothetical protein